LPAPLPDLPPQNVTHPAVHAAAKFLIDIQEGKRLTQSSMEVVRDRTNNLISTMKECLKVIIITINTMINLYYYI
jgi:hypothetical protein